MRLSLLPLGLALLVLTACQHHSISTAIDETGPLEAQLLEQEKIFPLPSDVSQGNGGDAPQQADGRHLPLVLFPYDRWMLTPQAKKILEQAGAWLRTYNHGELRVEGHTDPQGTTSYNYALGLRRASTVIRYLGNLGVDHKSMVPVSFGEDRPVCHEVSAYCDAMNRRAAVFVARREAHPLLLDLTDFTDGATPVPATTYPHD